MAKRDDPKPRATRSGKDEKPEPEPVSPKPEPVSEADLNAQALMKRAYRKVAQRLDADPGNGKAIDDLVKLAKLEKDLGGDEAEVKEIKVRWEPSEDESSSEG